jgi:MFS family permease
MAMATGVRVPSLNAYKIAWGIALIFYFLEYVARSAPAVMIPELSSAFRVNAVAVSTIIGFYYYTYSVAALVAGASLDRFGAKASVPFGCALLALGCVLFVVPVPMVGYVARLLQGAGSAFAFTGAVFLATHGFSGRVLATAVGFTQSFGMLGGSAGQFVVGPLIHGPLDWKGFWIALGLFCFTVAIALLLATPRVEKAGVGRLGLLTPFKTVFANPQSYLCGIVSGLLFVPTTVGDMIWGVALFEQDRGFDYSHAVSVASMVPLGWAIGCPLLGWLADYLGRRKPALIFGAVVMLLAVLIIGLIPALSRPAIYASMLMFGIGSGAAMIPYTIIKEVNPDEAKGSAVGVINFLTFAVTAAVGPLFAHLIGSGLSSNTNHLRNFQENTWFWAIAILVAIAVSLVLQETGHHRTQAATTTLVPGSRGS